MYIWTTYESEERRYISWGERVEKIWQVSVSEQREEEKRNTI